MKISQSTVLGLIYFSWFSLYHLYELHVLGIYYPITRRYGLLTSSPGCIPNFSVCYTLKIEKQEM